MLSRAKSVGLRAMRETASLPLRMMSQLQRGLALENMNSSMVSRVDVPAGSLLFATPTPLLQARAKSVMTKEPDTIRWIDGFEPGDVFWDVGANVGVFCLYAVRQRGVRVLAFEPSADNYAVLCRNVEINAFEERVAPYCIALSGETELGVLNSPSREMGASLHQFGQKGQTSRYWNGGNTTSAQGVVGFSIDDFIGQFRPPFPTRLKIDVDGLEWPILQGARNTLCDRRLKSVMAELPLSDEDERNRAMGWLSDAGLDLLSVGEVQESGGERAANHFFSRKNV
jgi:FkbM family methyltransferase